MAFKNILIFADICGLKSLFEEDAVVKLRKGQEAIEKVMDEIKHAFTEEEMNVIYKHFYVLNGYGEGDYPDSYTGTRTSYILRKARRLFFSKYDPSKI